MDGKRERIGRGRGGLGAQGRRVVYRNDGQGACDYWSVCAPAFRLELAHIEEAREERQANHVTVQVAHAQGEAFARPLDVAGAHVPGAAGATRAASCRSRWWETVPSAGSTARGARRTSPRTC